MRMCARARKRVHLFSSNEPWMKQKSSLYQLARQVCNGHLSPHEPSSPACSDQGPSAILLCIRSKRIHLSWSQIGPPFLLGKKMLVARSGARGAVPALPERPSNGCTADTKSGAQTIWLTVQSEAKRLSEVRCQHGLQKQDIRYHKNTHTYSAVQRKNFLLRQDSNEGFNALNSTAEGKILL